MAQVFQLEAVDEPPEAPPSRSEKLGTEMLVMGLRALSQRAIVAAATLFTLLTVMSLFWLVMSIPAPSTMQLIEIGMYGFFVLAANIIVRRA